jgi:signal transduction histidine kinase
LVISLSDRMIERGELTTADVERLAPPGTEVVLRDSAGAVVARTGPVLAEHVMSVEVQGPGGLSATVSADRSPVDRRVSMAWKLIAAVGLGIAALATVAELLEARHLSRPLDRLARTAAQLGAGEAGVVAPRSGVLEVDAIADALEDSGKRVAELMAAERQFSANASHQLRSPLTAIALSLELIADSTDPLARRESAEALTQVAGLDERINELLTLARTGRVAARTRIDVAALVRRHVQAITAQFHKAGRELSFVAPSIAEADVTSSALTQSVEILLDNALIHGSGDVEVRVSVDDAEQVEITIRDAGRLAQDDDGDRPAPDPEHSHGLGLLLARNLLRPDGGRVELTSAAPTTFVIRLPASGADLLPHEAGIGAGEQHDDAADEGSDLPPRQDEALGEGQRARQRLRAGVLDHETS